MGHFLDRVWDLLLSWELLRAQLFSSRGAKGRFREVHTVPQGHTVKEAQWWKSRVGSMNSLHPMCSCSLPGTMTACGLRVEGTEAGSVGGATQQWQKAPRGQAGLAVGVWGTATGLWLCGPK